MDLSLKSISLSYSGNFLPSMERVKIILVMGNFCVEGR